MAAKDLETTLTLIAKNAPALRAAGVESVTVGDVQFELSPPEPAPTTRKDEEEESNLDPIDDPDTYGGHVPRRRGADRELDEDYDDDNARR